VHAPAARRREENAEVVDAEIGVDDAGGDELAVGENLLDDDRFYALGASVGFKREDAAVD